jgi:hypothetical protein
MSIISQLISHELSKRERLATEQDKFLSDPTAAEQVLGHFAHGALPEKQAAKIGYGSTLDKIEKGIPSDDPRKNLASSIMQVAPQLITSHPDMHPAEVLSRAYLGKLGELNQDDSLYKFIREKNSSLIGGSVAEAPGYKEWKESQKKPDWEMTSPVESFLWGAGGSILGAVAGSFLGPGGTVAGRTVGGQTGAWLGRLAAKVAGQTIGDAAKKAVVAGVAAIPSFAAFDVPANVIRRSDWAQDRPIASLGAELVLGGAAMVGAEKAASVATGKFKNIMSSLEGVALDLEKDPSIKNLLGYAQLREGADEAAKNFIVKSDNLRASYTSNLVSGIARQKYTPELEAEYLKELQANPSSPASAMIKARESVESRFTAEGAMRKLQLDESEKLADEAEFQGLFKSRMTADPTLDPLAVTEQIKKDQLLMKGVVNAERFGGNEVDFSVPAIDQRLTKFVDKTKLVYGLAQEHGRNSDFVKAFTAEPIPEKPTDIITKIKRAHGLYDSGILDDNTFNGMIKPLEEALIAKNLGKTNKAVASIFDQTVVGPKWVSEAGTVLDGALNHSDPKIGMAMWDRTVAHFVESNPSIPDKKNFFSVLAEKAKTPKFETMYNNSREAFIQDVSDIVYGSKAKTMQAFKEDVKKMTKSQILEKYGKLGIYAGVGAVAAGLGLSVLSPESADAASIRFDPRTFRALKDMMPHASETALMEKIAEEGIHTPVISKDGDAVVSVMKSLNFVPQFDDIARKDRLAKGLDVVMTNGARGQFYFKQWSNPMVVIASKIRAAEENSYAHSKVVGNILKGFEDNSKDVMEAMQPLVDKYGIKVTQHSALRYQMDTIDSVLGGTLKGGTREDLTALSKRIKTGTVDEEDAGLIRNLQDQRAALDAKKQLLDPFIQERETEWNATVKGLAQQYPGVRMFLAASGKYGMKEEDPWLIPMLRKEELLAVGKIRPMLDDFGNRMVEAGEKKLTREDFIHYALHPGTDFNAERKALEQVMTDSGTGIDLAHFHHRSFDSLPMMPDIRYSLSRYIPDANRRIEMADFWKDWAPFMRKVGDAGMRGPFELLQDVAKGFSPVDRFGSWEKWADRIQMFEVARLISLSSSVAFKHGLKITADIAFYGFKNAFANLPKAVPLWKDMYVNNLLDKVPSSLKTDLARAYIGGKGLVNTISDLIPNEMNQTLWDKTISKWNQNTNFLVNNVELFDRGYSFTSAIAMATKKGMTPSQASYLVYDTILKANFLSGIQNPSWLRDPKVRLLLLFQGTPFKIFEQRMITAIKGGQAISSATQEFMRQLKADVVEGEKRFKWGVIQDALNAPKDLNGMSYAGQLARMILTTGGIIALGKYGGVDLSAHMLHIPFTSTTNTASDLAMNPAMSAVVGAWKNKENSEDGFTVDFLNKWLPNKGLPASIIKMGRLNKSDIPEMYRDSKFQYFFGIPSVKE